MNPAGRGGAVRRRRRMGPALILAPLAAALAIAILGGVSLAPGGTAAAGPLPTDLPSVAPPTLPSPPSGQPACNPAPLPCPEVDTSQPAWQPDPVDPGPSTCTPRLDQAPDTWVEVGAPEVHTYDTSKVDPAPQNLGNTFLYPTQYHYDQRRLPLPEYQVVIDPAMPCRAFRVDPGNRARIQRSLDGGSTWRTVFAWSSRDAAGHAFNARRLYLAGGRLYVTETDLGVTLITSGDAGQSWHPAAGTPGASLDPNHPKDIVGEMVYSLGAMTTEPSTVYVATLECFSQRRKPSSCTGVYHVHDDGESAAMGALRVFASHDAGATWAQVAGSGVGNAYNPQAERVPDCSMDLFWMVVDPFRDHVWLGFEETNSASTGQYATPPCHDASPNSGIEAIDGPGPDGAFAHVGAFGDGPFTVSRGPGGGERFWRGADYADGAPTGFRPALPAASSPTVPALADPDMVPVGVLADGRALQLNFIVYGDENRNDDSSDPRVLVLEPRSPEEYRLRLGARLSLPHYDPAVRTFHDSGVNMAGAMSAFTDALGGYYVQLGEVCWRPRCDVAQPQVATAPHWFRWHTMRYQPPDFPTALPTVSPVLAPSAARSCSTGCVALATPARAACPAGIVPSPGDTYPASHDVGQTLAFDGATLLYTRTGETAAAPYAAVVRRLDPAGCRDLGPIVVHFDPAEYLAVREATRRDHADALDAVPPLDVTLPAAHPTIDTLTYDPRRDRLLFTLNVTGDPPQQDNRVALWSAPLGGPGGARLTGTDATLVSDGLGFCTRTVAAAGSQVLAYDRASDSLYGCLPSRAAHLGLDGGAVDDRCVLVGLVPAGEAYDHLEAVASGYVDGAGHEHLFVLHQTRVASGTGPRTVVDYDLGRCGEVAAWAGPAEVTDQHGSPALACDPVTYGPGGARQFQAGAGGAGAAGAALWTRSGSRITAGLLPAGVGCAIASTLAYLGPPPVALGAGGVQVCGRLGVAGPDSGAAGQPLAISVDGARVGGGLTGPDGRFCAPFDAVQAGDHQVQVTFAGSAAYLANSAEGVLTVLPPGVAPPPPPPPVHPPRADPPLPPALPPIHLAAVAEPAPVPPVSVQVPGVPQAGAASEKEEEIQMAAAGQGSTERRPAEQGEAAGSLPSEPVRMSALTLAVAGLGTAFLALGLSLARAPRTQRVTPPPATAPRRRRARRARDRRLD